MVFSWLHYASQRAIDQPKQQVHFTGSISLGRHVLVKNNQRNSETRHRS